MKKIYFFILPIPVLVFLLWTSVIDTNKSEEKEELKEQENDWFTMQRTFPFGKVDYNAYQNATTFSKQQSALARTTNQVGAWQFAGTVNIGGRVTDVEMHSSSMQVMYVCAASGGIFKSVDAGINWSPIFDSQPTLSIGDLAIAPGDANTLYAGTGEANAGGGSLTYDGMGIYKSSDAGATWNYVGLDSTRNTGRVAINPQNKNIVYAATMGDLFGNNPQRGLYKTINGGTSWQKVLGANDSTGVIDVVIHPQHPDTVFACMWTRVRKPMRRHYGGPDSGIYRSYDGGTTWTKLTNGLAALGNLGRIGIDISQSNPNILYATICDENGTHVGIYKSINNGDSWTAVTTPVGAGFSYWYGRIKIDPVDPDRIYEIDFDLSESVDGGMSWFPISSSIHVDQHELFIHPLNTDMLLLGNDGGLHISYDGGGSWTHNDSLPITQFYTCEVDEQNPNSLYGGAQDNGVNKTPSGAFNDWFSIWGGDGFGVLVDPNNPFQTYAESQYGNLSCGINGVDFTDRFNWNTPFIFNPKNSNTLYLGSCKIYKSTDNGNNWNALSGDLTSNTGVATAYPIVYETITTLDVAASDTNVIYAGTDEGFVWVTMDEGQNWTNVTVGLPQRWVTHISVDPKDALSAYVTISGYRYHDNMSHVYHTTNAGQSWTDIGGNLPDVPVNDIVVDTLFNSLYLATDVGVFYSYINSNNWNALGTGMPIVPVLDLRLHYPTHTLLAGTYGRSMYKFDLTTLTGIPQTEIGNHSGFSLSVYPTLFKDNFNVTIYLNGNISGDLSLYDLSGKKITCLKNGEFSNGLNKISIGLSNTVLKNIKNGIYFIRFSSPQYNKALKLLRMN